MVRIEFLLVLSVLLICSFSPVKETAAFAAGLRYGKRTPDSSAFKEKGGPNVQLERQIGTSFYFMF